jgi:hypothetical protein
MEALRRIVDGPRDNFVEEQHCPVRDGGLL